MSGRLSPAEVEERIGEVCTELRQVTAHLYVASREAAAARHTYKVDYDTAYLDATGSVTDRRAQAVVRCDRQLGELEASQSRADVLYEAGRNLRSELDGLRSLSARSRDAITQRQET